MIETNKPVPPRAYNVDWNEVFMRFFKYMLEGIVVGIAAYTLPVRPPGFEIDIADIAQIAGVAMATFAILDFFAPSMSKAARMGAGAGIGANLVGFPGNQARHPTMPMA